MTDENPDYRPAQPHDFKRAIEDVDARDLEARRMTAATDRATERAYDAPTTPDYEYRAYENANVEDRRVADAPDRRPLDARRDVDAVDRAPATVATSPDVERERRVVPARETVTERRDYARGDRPFSIAAGFFGWAVASFFTLVLATIVLAVIGTAAYDASDAGTTGLTQNTFNDLTTGGLLGLAIALFVAYLLGGYAAGRIGLWHGTGHGVAVVAWTILFTLVTIGLAAAYGDNVAGLYLVPRVDWSGLTGPSIVGLVVALLVMLGGAILGANLGTRPYGLDGTYEGRRVRAYRGRPL